MPKTVGEHSQALYKLPTEETLLIKDFTHRGLISRLDPYLRAHLRGAAMLSASAGGSWCLSLRERASRPQGLRLKEEALRLFPGEGTHSITVDTYVSEPEGGLWIHNVAADLWQHWFASERKVEAFYTGRRDNEYQLVQEAYAAVRLLTYALIHPSKAGMLIHSGAVACGQEGVLLVGPKGSGKTTLTTAMLLGGAAYLSSDRSFVWYEKDCWWVSGWSGTYRTGYEDLKLFADAALLERAVSYMERFTDDPNYSFKGKFRFPPMNFLNLIGREPQYKAKLSSVVSLSPVRTGAARLSRVRREQGLELIREHKVAVALPKPLSAVGAADAATQVEAMAFEGVRFFRLRGAGSPFDNASMILERLCRQ